MIHRGGAVLVIGAVAAVCSPAAAQMASKIFAPGEQDMDRPRLESESPGIELGSFVGYLSAGLATVYDDNIRAVDESPEADVVAVSEPRLLITSRWDRHGLHLEVGGRWARHIANTEESHLDRDAAVSGHLDLGTRARIGAAVAAAREHEDRGSPEEPGRGTPSSVNRLRADADGEYRFTRLGLGFRASYESLAFQDSLPGVDEDAARDRTRTALALRGRYQYYPGLEPYVELAARRVNFARQDVPSGLNRDFQAQEALLGVVFDVTRKVSGEAHAGYRLQEHEDAALGTLLGPLFGLTLVSPVTPTLTLSTEAERGIKDTAVPGAAAFESTHGHIGARYAPLHRLLLETRAGYIEESYVEIERRDRIRTFFAGATYALNPYVHLLLTYDFTKRTSNVDANFTRNRVSAGARLRY